MNQGERYIAIKDADTLSAQREAMGGMSTTDIATRAVEFVRVERRLYTAEYTPDGQNIVVHFFLPEVVRHGGVPQLSQVEHWWLNDFGLALSSSAEEFFCATLPRLQAKYTAEVASWWFKAQGYGHLLDRTAFVEKFLDCLDKKLTPTE